MEIVPGQCDKCDTAPAVVACAPAAAPPVEDPCPDCGGACLGPETLLTEADCQWLGNRLDRFAAARPDGAPALRDFAGYSYEELCDEQLLAYEEGVERWWLVVPPGEDDDPGEWHWYDA